MITPDDRVKVLDFGLAKAIAESSEPSDLTHSPTLMDEKTREGVILGTAPYMSPEQVEGMPLDRRTDIFSIGSLIYEMVTGRKAFPGKTQARVLAGILEKEPRPLGKRVRGVPQQLEWVVARCLRKDPERRFQHMRDLRLALEDVLQELQSPRRWGTAGFVIDDPAACRRRPGAGGASVRGVVVGNRRGSFQAGSATPC